MFSEWKFYLLASCDYLGYTENSVCKDGAGNIIKQEVKKTHQITV